MSRLDEQKEDIKYVKFFDSYYSMKQQTFHEQLFLSNGDENIFNINIALSWPCSLIRFCFHGRMSNRFGCIQKNHCPTGCPCENAAGLPTWYGRLDKES